MAKGWMQMDTSGALLTLNIAFQNQMLSSLLIILQAMFMMYKAARYFKMDVEVLTNLNLKNLLTNFQEYLKGWHCVLLRRLF